MTEREDKAHRDGMGVGMVIAAAIIVDHDPVYAEEILGAAGLTTVKEMRAVGCDDYDINQLRAVVRDIARRKRLAATRAPTPPSTGASE